MKKNDFRIISLSKFLLNEIEDISPLKMQKLLFFLRFEEIQDKNVENSFFKEKDNFEAWINGPVNRTSYLHFRDYFWKLDEDDLFLDLDNSIRQEISDKYSKYLEKYKDLEPEELVEKSHKNQSWKNARKGYKTNDICKVHLIEDKTFITFD